METYKVFQDRHGYYIGTAEIDPNIGPGVYGPMEVPATRDSGFFETYEEAQAELKFWNDE